MLTIIARFVQLGIFTILTVTSSIICAINLRYFMENITVPAMMQRCVHVFFYEK